MVIKIKLTVDVRQINRFATDFYHFLVEKSHKNTFSICQTVGGNVTDSFSDGNTCLDRAFPFSKLIREFSMLSVVGNGLLRLVSKFFSMFMSNPMRWKNDYFLCKYLIIFHLYIIWNAQVKSGNCYFTLFIGKYEN